MGTGAAQPPVHCWAANQRAAAPVQADGRPQRHGGDAVEGDPQVLAIQPARMHALINSAAMVERAPAAGMNWPRGQAHMHASVDSVA